MKTIKIKVLSKSYETKEGRKFKKYFTPVSIVISGEEDKGLQPKTIDVKFTKGIEPKVGIYELEPKQLSLPNKFVIDVDSNGKKSYPTAWIRGYVSVKPLPITFKNCHPIVDEEDDEDTEIE